MPYVWEMKLDVALRKKDVVIKLEVGPTSHLPQKSKKGKKRGDQA